MVSVYDQVQSITADAYHALPGVSNSQLSDFIEDPRIYHYKYLSGEYKGESKGHFDFGQAVHDICLLGSAAGLVVIPPDVLSKSGAKSGKAWEIWASDNTGKILLKQHEYDSVMRCVAAVRLHPVAGRLLAMAGECESLFSHTDESLELDLRCRPDKLIAAGLRRIVFDLKTTSTGTQPAKFVRHVANYGYHRQMAFYRRVLKGCGVEVDSCVIVAVSTTQPHTVDCYTLDDDFLRLGEIAIENALLDLAERTRANDWQPRSGDSIVSLSPPNYLKFEDEYTL